MRHLSILVADDDLVVRKLLENRLKKAGHHITTVTNGDEAKKLLDSTSFDVVIADLQMPGAIDGLALLEISKRLHPESEVLLITAHSSIDSAVAAMKKGAADYLEKPINVEELLLRIEKITTLKNLMRTANDIGDALEITESEAAATIQNLELRATTLQNTLEEIENIVNNTTIQESTRIATVSQILASLEEL